MSKSDKQGYTRKHFLRSTTAFGLGGLAFGPILGSCEGGAYTRGVRGPAARTVPFNTGWLFGGEAPPGSMDSGFDDSKFEQVTLPHTVTNLSWRQ